MWKPISLNELEEHISLSELEFEDELLNFWKSIRIVPEKWQEKEYGIVGNGFWVVAIFGTEVVYYNDIEEGFNVSEYETYGQIKEYWCNQSELKWEITELFERIRSSNNLAIVNNSGQAPMQTNKLTIQILAYRELEDFNIDLAVDWAVEMLTLGYETPSVLILAGISKPTSFFEAEKYLLNSLNELGIVLPERHEAIIGYCKHFIEEIGKSVSVKTNLYKLYKIAQTIRDENSVFDFYLFYWAWSDLDYGQIYQHYVPEATKDNIEILLIKRAKKWLKDHQFSLDIKE